jgi:AcrR family transcriptional regulator
MISAAARDGYGNASVARVIGQAGVSRATFYEHFTGKEECFLAAYREVAGQVGGGFGEVGLSRGSAVRPRDVLARLLVGADRDPARARLLLIEALAGDPSTRSEHEQILLELERSVESYLSDQSRGELVLDVSARAILGGIGSVVAMRIFRGETGDLAGLLDDMMAWVDSYALSDGSSRHSRDDWAEMGKGLSIPFQPPAGSDAHRALPRGRSALPQGAVAREHRDRILDAVARVSVERGYLAMTITDITAAAGVTREAFYTLFRRKEDAFLAAQTMALQESVSRAAGEFFGATEWAERVWNAARAMIGFLCEHSDLGYLELVESYAAGAAAIRHSFDSRMAYTLFLEDGYRQRESAERLPRLCSEAIGGALLELLRRHVVQGKGDRLPELIPEGVYVAIAPFIGPERATEFVEARAAAETAAA